MSTTIQIKRSSTASAVPLSGDLEVGELAINLADKRLFTKKSDGTIVELSTNPTDIDIATLRIDGVEVTASAAELNSLDGSTASTADLNKLAAITATATELNVLDGFTGSTAELNLLDGVTATTAELNFVDGVTSNVQTQLNAKQPLDAQLTDIAGLTPTDGSFIVGNGVNFVAESGNTAIASLGVTATAAELNTLDGVTASTTELNYTDGVTSNIQTQLNGKATSAQGALADTAVQPNDNVTFGTGDFTGDVDVTGTITADGLTVDGAAVISGVANANLQLTSTGGNTYQLRTDVNSAYIYQANRAVPIAQFGYGGDVSFYEDTGTTAKMVWDASAESLGIGTASPSAVLETHGGTSFIAAKFKGYYTGRTAVMGGDNNGAWLGVGGTFGQENSITFQELDNSVRIDTNGAERVRIDSSGNLLVNTTNTDPAGGNVNGSALLQYGGASMSRTNTPAIDLNRSTSDGAIATFRKDGATVGSIASDSGNILQLNSGGNDKGVFLARNGSNVVGFAPNEPDVFRPATFDTCDLGKSDRRFKDLYLSGGVITSSDYRLKEDIQPMQSYADTVKQMNLVNFAWKESGTREDGFIAHELQALVPSAVRGDKDAINEDGEAQHQGVDPLKLIPVLAKALQEALERIEILENK